MPGQYSRDEFVLTQLTYLWTLHELITLVDIGGGLSQFRSGERIAVNGLDQAYAHPASSRNCLDALEQDGRSMRLGWSIGSDGASRA